MPGGGPDFRRRILPFCRVRGAPAHAGARFGAVLSCRAGGSRPVRFRLGVHPAAGGFAAARTAVRCGGRHGRWGAGAVPLFSGAARTGSRGTRGAGPGHDGGAPRGCRRCADVRIRGRDAAAALPGFGIVFGAESLGRGQGLGRRRAAARLAFCGGARFSDRARPLCRRGFHQCPDSGVPAGEAFRAESSGGVAGRSPAVGAGHAPFVGRGGVLAHGRRALQSGVGFSERQGAQFAGAARDGAVDGGFVSRRAVGEHIAFGCAERRDRKPEL